MIQTSFALLIFLFPLAYSPGPGNMFFAAVGARYGFVASLPAHFGYHLATWGVTALIGFGFSAVLNAFPAFFDVLRYCGAAYILWLAVKLLRAGPPGADIHASPAHFWAGVWLMVLNPKAYVIIAAMFAQFLNLYPLPLWGQVMVITTIFTLNNQIAFFIWTGLGVSAGRLVRSPFGAIWMNWFFAVMLILVMLWMFAGRT